MGSVYRTVSEPAMMVIAGVISAALLAECKAIYKRKEEEPKKVVAREERERTLDEQQPSW